MDFTLEQFEGGTAEASELGWAPGVVGEKITIGGAVYVFRSEIKDADGDVTCWTYKAENPGLVGRAIVYIWND